MGDGVRSSGNNTKTKKASLRNTMKKHNDSKAHQAAKRTLNLRVKETWKTCSSQVSAKDVCTSEKIFRSVYFLAKSNRPFSDHPEICQLQRLNGIDLGVTLHSRYSATSIVETISHVMRANLCRFITDHQMKLSVLLDESTTVSRKSAIVMYIRVSSLDFTGWKDSGAITFPQELAELDALDAQTITSAFLALFAKHGFNDKYIKANLIGACSDGASTMLGSRSGVLTRLKQQFPRVQLWHFVSQKLTGNRRFCKGSKRNQLHANFHGQALLSLFHQSKNAARVGILFRRFM